MINIDKIQKEAAATANNAGYCCICGSNQYLLFHLILDVGWQIECGECGTKTDFYKNLNEAVAAWNRKAVYYQGLYEIEKIYNDIKYIHITFPLSLLKESSNGENQSYYSNYSSKMDKETINKIIEQVNKSSSQQSKEGAKNLELQFKDMKVEV